MIINYTTNNQETWCLLLGVSASDMGIGLKGNMQLFNIESQKEQIIEGYAGCFGEIPLRDAKFPSECFAFIGKKDSEIVTRIHVVEINKSDNEQNFRAAVEILNPIEAQYDFPIAMHMINKYGVIVVITKAGFLLLFETISAHLVYRVKISDEPIFATAKNIGMDSVLGVNRKGQVFRISIEEANIIPFIMNYCQHIPNNMSVSFSLAQRFNLEGSEEFFVHSFNCSLEDGDIKNAGKIAARAPGSLLRNQETINRIHSLPIVPGQPHPILVYSESLLETSKLNNYEVLEIARHLMKQNLKHILETWICHDKIECSQELEDLVMEYDGNLALQISLRISSQGKN